MISQRQKVKRRNKNILSWVLLLVSLSVVIGIAWFMYTINQSTTKIDEINNCPVDGSPEYITIIFDKSDAFNTIQQIFLKRFFTQFKENIKEGTFISFYSINDKKNQKIEPSFVLCSPKTGKEANYFYENPEKIKKIWKEKFEKPLDERITSFMKPSISKISPIMEILQMVSLSTPLQSMGKQKEIIIISDMLQHTSKWSHYKNQYDIEKIKKSNYFNQVKTNLDNASVTILLVRREGYESFQIKKLAYFWADYIQLMNGNVKSIEQIDG